MKIPINIEDIKGLVLILTRYSVQVSQDDATSVTETNSITLDTTVRDILKLVQKKYECVFRNDYYPADIDEIKISFNSADEHGKNFDLAKGDK